MNSRTRIVFLVAALGFCAAIAIGMGTMRTAGSARAVSSAGAAAGTASLPLCIDRTEPDEPDVLVPCR